MPLTQGRPRCLWHVPDHEKLNWSAQPQQQFDEFFKSHLAAIGAQGKADFRGVVFPPNISFDGITLGHADFRDARFLGEASFRKTRFTSLVTFGAAQFSKAACFDGASFLGKAHFDGAKFAGDLSCEGATFERGLAFSKVEVRGDAQFGKTRFGRMADFEGTQFHSRGRFPEATFETAFFHKALIMSSADFCGCAFSARANFIDTTFGYSTEFDAATFMKDAHFDSGLPETARLRQTTWRGTSFSSNVSFNNRVFTTRADFSETVFGRAPTYHGCTFHEAMLSPPQENFRQRTGGNASEAYRTLRLAMENMSAHLEAGKFYALEQESRRNTPGEMKRHERLLSLLYSAISDYGRNALRPLTLVLALLLALVPIYAITRAPLSFGTRFDGDLVIDALNFSLQQVVSPFGLWREQPKGSLLLQLHGAYETPAWVIWTAALQSLLSFVFVSLSLLAIRWRFKREYPGSIDSPVKPQDAPTSIPHPRCGVVPLTEFSEWLSTIPSRRSTVCPEPSAPNQLLTDLDASLIVPRARSAHLAIYGVRFRRARSLGACRNGKCQRQVELNSGIPWQDHRRLLHGRRETELPGREVHRAGGIAQLNESVQHMDV